MKRGALAVVTFLAFTWGAPSGSAAASRPIWVRLEVVENSAEGPAADRCALDGTLDGQDGLHWRVFYGEVRGDPAAGWAAVRSRSGCAHVASEADPGLWTLRGSPYLLVDIALTPGRTVDGVIHLDATLTIRTLTGFGSGGTPVYDRRTEQRPVQVPQGGGTAFSILVANAKEREEFGVRELFVRLQATELGSPDPAQYGELAVTSDLPLSTVLLDGGVIGRASAAGSLLLPTVRTGERMVAIRDASGREAQQLVEIAPGRRSALSLLLLPEAPPSAAAGLRPLGRNPLGSEELWRERDGAIVVRIPGGDLQMGSLGNEGEPAERPRHAVRLDGFLMDKTEVTWGQYGRFIAQTGHAPAKAPGWGMPDTFPVSNVTWEDARAFCAWVGGRLPTEAEWERAARGDDTRRFPWGDEWSPSRCNTRDGGPHALTPVATYPDCIGPYGVLDQAGSVWEWCADWYDEAYYLKTKAHNPKGPETGDRRVSRGGSWINPSDWVRTSYRQGTDPTWPDTLRGFRCVQDDHGIAVAPPPATADTTSSPIEIVLETSASPETGAPQRCEVVQAAEATAPALSWSTFAKAQPEPGGGFRLAPAPARCGRGALRDSSRLSSGGAAPFLLLEVSATPMFDQGAMHPGPGREIQIALAVTARQLTGFSPEGAPLYGDPTIDHRAARVSPSDELLVPVRVGDAVARSVLGPEVLLRIRRDHRAAAYGSILVIAAVPDSEILVDGGVVARAGRDGTATLTGFPVGPREVRLQGGAERRVSRIVTVIPQATVVASGRDATTTITLKPDGKNAQGAAEFQRPRDGATMVQIPAGEFLMGNLDAEGAPLPHPVRLSSFLIDKLPVTWARFKQFAAATGWPLPPAPYWGIHDDHPAVFVAWDEARAYCEWAGARLPTEAEREKAARGTDGRLFPWGNEQPTPERAVFRRNWGYEGTDVVGTRPAGASPYGVLDAGGNVWEWCEDWHDADYYRSSPTQDPPGPRSGRARIVRGGSWDSRPSVLAGSCRNWGYVGYREGDFGFRCAADSPR